MKNTLSHLYLYAKGHYEKNDVVEDLKIIVGQICGIDPKHLSTNDVARFVIKYAFQHMNEQFADPLTAFRDFLVDIPPEHCSRVGYYLKGKPYDFDIAVIHKCLSVLCMVDVRKGDKIVLELDVPDPAILPLKKKEKK
jgi:hypothetical protein